MKKLLTLLVGTTLILCGCHRGESSSSSGKQEEERILHEVYKDYFSIGAALNEQNRTNDLLKHFNSMTCENAMKWAQVHPTDDSYTYADADSYIAIAKENNIKVRGHALVWHEAIPDTVFQNGDTQYSKEEILAKETAHIENVMRHFGDDVYCWDVVNEVIDDNQSELAEDLSNVYRKSKWYETCGEDFIFNAFETANRVKQELGLNVKLYYNDYSNDTPYKLEKTIAMIKRIQERGIHIDGIGMQSHYHLGSFDIDQLEKAIKAYIDLGLDIQITEFDINIYDETLPESSNAAYYYNDYASVPENALKVQTSMYNRAFELFRKYKDNISNVTFWGVSDANTYMNSDKTHVGRTNYPYIFDVYDEPKDSFYAITEFDVTGEKHYDPYNVDEEEVTNIYKGDKKDFHINTWYPSDIAAIEIEENLDSGQVDAKYRKTSGNEYAHLYTTVNGPFADFTYINIKAKGTPGKSIAFRLCFDNIDLEKSNVLGNDVSFSLTDEYVIHTLKIKGTYKTRADLLAKVCIFPEIGVSGSTIRDEISFVDCWFSQSIPEGGQWENKGVDSGDTSVSVNGWKTQAWTFYTLYASGTNTGITYSKAAEWAYIEKEVEVHDGDNVLTFTFENIKDALGNLSVSHIVFKLSGDVKEHITEGVEYDYYTYYESIIYVYDLTKENEVQPDENGLVNLDIPITNAIGEIGDHHENGYRVVILVESRPDDFDKFLYERDGHMIVHDTYCSYKEDVKTDNYTQYGESTYVLTDKEGVDKNVTYTDIRGDAYWPRLCRHINTNVGDSINLVLRNNGENSVRVGIHAGIYNDDRSDAEKNNMFFPLYMNNGIGAAGYYEDGNTIDIEAGEEIEVLISVDETTEFGVDASKDAINVIGLLIDNCYGDTELRSGNIDIVSVEVVK